MKNKLSKYLLCLSSLFALTITGCGSREDNTSQIDETTSSESSEENMSIKITAEGGVNSIKVGESVQLHAVVSPSSASQEVIWSTNDDYINISQTGLVSGVKAGVATIYAASKVDSSIRGRFSLRVYEETKPVEEKAFDIITGNISEKEGVVTTSLDSTIALKKESTFTQGTITVHMNLNGNNGDNGVIFGVKNVTSKQTGWWEGNGISYYFFFISNAGSAYLGKTVDAGWENLGETPIQDLNRKSDHELKISLERKTDFDIITCFIDGVMYVTYRDFKPIHGEYWGIRSARSGIKYDNYSISSDVVPSGEEIDGFYTAHGGFEKNGDSYVSITGNAILEKKDDKLAYGTFEARVNAGGVAGDNGIIFALTPNSTHSYWENEISYLFFFINFLGYAYLGMVDNGSWSALQAVQIAGYSPNNSYLLTVERSEDVIDCYVNNQLMISDYSGTILTGTGYGFRAANPGVTFSDMYVDSYGEIVVTHPDDLEVVTGAVNGTNGFAKAANPGTLALLKDKEMSAGTFTATISGVHMKRSGLVFGYSHDGEIDSYYRLVTNKTNQKVLVEKVVGNEVVLLYSNYLSAGYTAGVGYSFRVVITNSKAYCYFWNTLYAVIDMELTGTKVGIYSEEAGSVYKDYQVSESEEVTKVNTLLFGHSYFELWKNYREDLAETISSRNLGTYTNIGIGGSIASHWYTFREAIKAYEAKQYIYMIGINDLTGSISPQSVMDSISMTLAYLKEANPSANVVLLSVNHCPARTNIASKISELNNLMKAYCAQNTSWVKYGELEYAFCNDGVNPTAAWFTDGLHPTAEGYKQKIVPAINDALDNKNQPTL